MIETRLFIFGVFVVLLFSIGIFYTIKEFRDFNEEKQKQWRNKSKGIRVEDDIET